MISLRPHRHMATRLLLLLLSSLVLHSRVIQAAKPTHANVEFARIDGQRLLLDVYQPKGGEELRPLIVWVHGGAWRAGSKESVPIERMLDHGFAIASVEYRLSPVARFPAQVHDIKAAIRFLRANAERYDLDPKRFVVAGASAGGHLAALVGLSNGVAPLEGSVGELPAISSQIQAAVSFYGASNLQTILSQSTPHGLSVRVPALKLLLGGSPAEKPDLARLASPIAHLDPRDPPLWLIHGDADPQMPIEQSRELAQAMTRMALPVRLRVISGAKHGGDIFYTDERLDELAGELTEILGQTGTMPLR